MEGLYIASEYTKLLKVVTKGEPYVLPPLGPHFTLRNMLTAVDEGRYPGGRRTTYPLDGETSDFNHCLWFPKDSTKEGYSTEEINRMDVAQDGQDPREVTSCLARIALMNGPKPNDSILQLLGLPYDEMFAEAGQPTQLTELAKAQDEFAKNKANEGYELTPTSVAGFVMLALQARIKGEELPSSWGYMHIPQLGRKTVDDSSVVGIVHSRGGRLMFKHSGGGAYGEGGVGFSVGQIEA